MSRLRRAATILHHTCLQVHSRRPDKLGWPWTAESFRHPPASSLTDQAIAGAMHVLDVWSRPQLRMSRPSRQTPAGCLLLWRWHRHGPA